MLAQLHKQNKKARTGKKITGRSKAERRQCPRLRKALPLNIAANGYDFATTTENVSCLGAYCRIDKYVPPFTRIMVKLILPLSVNGKKGSLSIDCQGVVVRTEDADTGGFNIAIFFNDIKDAQRQKISQYISSFIPG